MSVCETCGAQFWDDCVCCPYMTLIGKTENKQHDVLSSNSDEEVGGNLNE